MQQAIAHCTSYHDTPQAIAHATSYHDWVAEEGGGARKNIMIIQPHSNIAITTIIQYPTHPYHALTPLPSTRVVIPRLGDSSLLFLCSSPLFAFVFPSSLPCTIVSMDPTVALPLVMPGRFGVVCRPSIDHEGPFNRGTHCVTLIPTKLVLREWAELIVENWNNARWSSWSPYRSVVVVYCDENEVVFADESKRRYYLSRSCFILS